MEQVQPIAFGVSCLHSQISIDNPFLSVSFMERLRLVVSLKVHISFAKEPYKRDDILQKRPIIWAYVLRAGHTLNTRTCTLSYTRIYMFTHNTYHYKHIKACKYMCTPNNMHIFQQYA